MVGPNYRRPPAPVPTAFKEKSAGWLEGSAAQRRRAKREVVGDLQRSQAQCARRAGEHFESERAGGRSPISSRAGRGSDCAFGFISDSYGGPHIGGSAGLGRSFGQSGSGRWWRPHHLSNSLRCLLSGGSVGQYPAQHSSQRRNRASHRGATRKCQTHLPGGLGAGLFSIARHRWRRRAACNPPSIRTPDI